MGRLIEGKWHDVWYDTKSNQGKFKREDAQLRNWITADGSAGPTGDSGFKAESGRYHLYVSLACPWAHRTLIFRRLKQLEAHIDVSVVSPDMLEQGWTFDKATGSSGDTLFAQDYMHQLYTRNKADYSGRVTVPVLWDKHTQRIVSNESSEIIRMFNSAFNELTGNTDDYYPEALRPDIDDINDFVYHKINNGVYKAGFATEQAAYEEALQALFEALEQLEQKLSKQRYLVGDTLTEADWRLFTTLIRFDSVYHGHFKCNLKQIENYPNLAGYIRELYQWPNVAETVDFYHIKRHYYFSHTMINPTQVVPVGPDIDYSQPHHRG
ncbi:glutathione S-transferase family protein [Pseudoalteromonas ardens]|uniref:Glutathionyl-hydroquinone reductase YqjG n=1 Tax=Pseudoalteromonas rubra TaxID=43658 RepID=A0A0L0EWE5_9GAMM|nr:glutathione S-transferase family protein [Pseudoalteromonas sp. R96]KNC68740.1 glutathionyl-hydroquinone reductase YqjG [Pseudoalteromonas rubra]MDK1310297.1 glutathione S-transferase family protein [Pseudoalteromonas sp. R96]